MNTHFPRPEFLKQENHGTTRHVKVEGFSLKSRCKSFVFAWSGIVCFFKEEHNAWIHLMAAVLVTTGAIMLHISRVEAIVVIFSVALVWITEMINTAIEKAMDFISQERHPLIRTIKDIAAGAVLIAAIAAAMAGGLIFIPKILQL